MGPVEKATWADLRQRGVSVQQSGLAAAAVRLAKALDDPATSATGAATAARELRAILGELASLSARTRPLTSGAETEQSPPSDLDRIRREREKRRGT